MKRKITQWLGLTLLLGAAVFIVHACGKSSDSDPAAAATVTVPTIQP